MQQLSELFFSCEGFFLIDYAERQKDDLSHGPPSFFAGPVKAETASFFLLNWSPMREVLALGAAAPAPAAAPVEPEEEEAAKVRPTPTNTLAVGAEDAALEEEEEEE